MDYSTWLSSASLDLPNNNNNNSSSTLRLFDDAPVKDVKMVSVDPPRSTTTTTTTLNEVASKLWPIKDETGALMEELNRVNAENKRLTEMLTVVCENYNELKRQLTEYMNKSSSNNEANNKKRKLDSSNNTSNGNTTTTTTNNNNNAVVVRNNNVESSSSDEEDSYEKQKEETIKAKITRVAIRTEASDSSLILKDGYQWRKYGQKVTRDNPCPRAYFKCSFAPSCPVKKKVQRSLEDQSMLVATYEGDHNHLAPTQAEGAAPNRSMPLGSAPCNASSAPTVTLDLTKPKPNVSNDTNTTNTNNSINNNNNMNVLNSINCTSSNQVPKFSSAEFQKLLAEQMASSLTKDPNFTAALAAAITGRFAQQSSSD